MTSCESKTIESSFRERVMIEFHQQIPAKNWRVSQQVDKNIDPFRPHVMFLANLFHWRMTR